MKNLFRGIVFIVSGFSFIACGQTVTATSSPTLSLTTTGTATLTVTPLPSPTATATTRPTSPPEYLPPTLIPTIDPTLVPELLSKALSVQTIEGVNGHQIQQITGWDYGFGGGLWWGSCSGYSWLDSSHLVLYPATGQIDAPDGVWGGINVVPQSVVINLESGHVWLPPEAPSSSPRSCNRAYWSSDLGILIVSEEHDDISTVSTYTYDGQTLSSYTGNIMDVSPRGTKIILADNTLIDLRTNEKIMLDWSLEGYQEEMLSDLFWTSDETRIYRCCYFYADLTTGTSYHFEQSEFQDTNGKPLEQRMLWFYRGGWIQNDTYFLVTWSWIDDGDIRYLPMLDPAKQIFLDVREKAGIPADWSCVQTTVSPDGRYMWMTGWSDSYLVDLVTFKAQYYPRTTYLDIGWSPNSKFALLHNSDSADETDPYSILSVIDKKLKPLPVAPLSESIHWWHESDDILIYPSEDKDMLLLLDTSTMSFQELPFRIQTQSNSLVWDPNGKKIAFVAEAGSVWQVDYPTLENLEQLTPSLPSVGGLEWSPDANSIAFISGPDIYIVETTK